MRLHGNGSATSRECARTAGKRGAHDSALSSQLVKAPIVRCDPPFLRVAGSREGPTCGCGKRSAAPFHCLRIVFYNGSRNCNVSRLQSCHRTVWPGAKNSGLRCAPSRLVAQLHLQMESPARVGERRAVEARRPEGRGRIVREAVALLVLPKNPVSICVSLCSAWKTATA